MTNESKTADSYNIPVRLIKLIKNIITEPLTYSINLSFSSRYYPKILKYGKIIPIFKANSQDQVNNYCPISVLPILSKICEKLMYARLINFIQKNKICIHISLDFKKINLPPSPLQTFVIN